MDYKYKWLRLAIKLRKKVRTPEKVNIREQEVMNIVNNAIHDSTCTLMQAPLSNKRFIKSKNGNLFIIIDDVNVTIANHKYHYDITTSLSVSKELYKKFDKVLEHKMMKMEKEIMDNVLESLKEIEKETKAKTD